MYISKAEAMEIARGDHTGSCKGQGIKHGAYHGYVQDGEGNLVLLRCPCCHLECGLCREWAIRYMRTSLNQQDRPPMKAPPMEGFFVHSILAALFVTGPCYFGHAEVLSNSMLVVVVSAVAGFAIQGAAWNQLRRHQGTRKKGISFNGKWR